MIKQENILKMAEVRSEWCVSIYLPINNKDIDNNQIRLKNLMLEAERKLIQLNVYPLRVAKILAPIQMLLDNPAFWENRRQGVSAFLTPDLFFLFELPSQPLELVEVTDSFHLKPLLRCVSQMQSFYLLTLSQKEIKFYEVSKAGLNEIILRGMPRSLEHYLLSMELQKSLQMHSAGSASVLFHEQTEIENSKKAKIVDTFRKVNKVVTDFLKNEEKPLILAGIDYLHPIYHSVNSYQNIAEKGVIGNIDNLSPKKLLEKIQLVVNPMLHRERELASNIYKQKIGTGLASQNLSEILKAAADGRVETLFVTINKQKWGRFNNQTRQIQFHKNPLPGDTDLFCLASANTLLKGGKVFVVMPDEMPDKSPVAAVMRF